MDGATMQPEATTELAANPPSAESGKADESADVSIAGDNSMDATTTATITDDDATANNNNNDATETPADVGQTAASNKNPRKRKKHIFNAIRHTMEFYFSDANLSKDRFLLKLIQQDVEVPLATFLTFNKIKAMCRTVEDIEKAISNSDQLQLSADRSKVSRRAPLASLDARQTDDCTIYVEPLPADATHDWLRKLFEPFGAVAYVSLPKYRQSHRAKEFAFIEFEASASVEQALKAFGEFGGVLNMQTSVPDQLCSIVAYQREQDAAKATADDADGLAKTIAEADLNGGGDRTTLQSTGDVDAEPSAKKLRTEAPAEQLESAVDAAAASELVADESTPKADDQRMQTAPPDAALDGLKLLRICSKLEWKRLRNKYLNEQRAKVSQLKKAVWEERQAKRQQRLAVAGEPAAVGENVPATTAEQASELDAAKARPMFTKRSNNAPAAEPAPIDEAALLKAPTFSYEPGIIVQVHFAQPCVDVKDFKAEMRQHEFVRYVDVKEGAMSAFVRVSARDSADTLISRAAPLRCEVLHGDVEQQYWDKMNSDRLEKITKQVKVKPKRGREKVKKTMRKAEVQVSHVRFDD